MKQLIEVIKNNTHTEFYPILPKYGGDLPVTKSMVLEYSNKPWVSSSIIMGDSSFGVVDAETFLIKCYILKELKRRMTLSTTTQEPLSIEASNVYCREDTLYLSIEGLILEDCTKINLVEGLNRFHIDKVISIEIGERYWRH